MANEKNLINLKNRPQRERKEIARKGAIASNKSQKERKTANELVKMLLKNKAEDVHQETLKGLGFEDDDTNNLALMISSIFKKCVTTGDINAFNKLLEIAGENQNNDKNGILDELLSDFEDIK